MLKNHSIASSSTIAVGDLHQRRVVERDEVHREPGAHRLARLRVAEDDAAAVRDPVDRALAAGGELHHEQVGAALVREQLDGLLEPHRHRAGPLVEELVRAVDGRVEDAEAARAGGEDRLEADGPVGVAELARGRLDLARRRSRGGSRAPGRRGGAAARSSRPCRSSGGSSRGRRRAPGRGKPPRCSARPWRSNELCGSTTSTPSRSTIVPDRVGEARVGARRDEVERVAEVAADRALGHVRADEADVALAVLAQGAEQRGRPGRARGGDEDGRHVRSIRSLARCVSRASRSASRNASIVSRIVSPG